MSHNCSLSPAEKTAWNNISFLLAPDGVIDKAAVRLYLSQHLMAKMGAEYYQSDKEDKRHKSTGLQGGQSLYSPNSIEVTTLTALIKKAPDIEESKKVFILLYQNLRAGGHMQDLLVHMSRNEPHKLAHWIADCMQGADLTLRVSILQDAKRYLPGQPIERYLGSTWDRVSAKGFNKTFTPAVNEIPYIMEAAFEMNKSENSVMRKLGQMLQTGCFVATYGTQIVPATDTQRQYSACQAFSLAQTMQPRISAKELFDSLQGRFKGETVFSDALGYVISCLENDIEHSFAQEVLSEVIRRDNSVNYNSYAAIYALASKSAQWSKSCENITSFMKKCCSDSKLTPFRQAHRWTNATQPLETILDEISKLASDAHNQLLLSEFLFPHHSRESIYRYVSELGVENLSHVVLDRCTPEQIIRAIEQQFKEFVAGPVGTSTGADYSPSVQREAVLLLHVTSKLLDTPFKGKDELKCSLKQSSFIPKLILTHLLLGSRYSLYGHHEYLQSQLPNLKFQPFYLARQLYPEHGPLWNGIQLKLLALPVSTLEKDMEKIRMNMFDTFASIYGLKNLDVNSLINLAQSLGISPAQGFLQMDIFSKPPQVFNIDDTTFDFANI